MNKRLQEALDEIAGHQFSGGLSRIRPYYFRTASMRSLAEMGLVERMAGYGSDSQPAWRITDAGRAAATRPVDPTIEAGDSA